MSLKNLLRVLTFVLLVAPLGYSLASRTWVSGIGSDANPCSRTAPCRTFAGTISKTAPGGEIDVLDPGGFGVVTITKAVTIDGGGGQVASVLASGTDGIVVKAGANDVVILRNLRLNGTGQVQANGGGAGGLNGIKWITGKALHIENCTIFGFTLNAIDIEKTDAINSKAFVINTIANNNAGNGLLATAPAGGTVTVSIYGSHFDHNQNGVNSGDRSVVNVGESEASGNGDGFVAIASAATAELNLSSCVAANNSSVGVFAGGGVSSIARITGVTLYNDTAGLTTGAAGQILSAGNNTNSSGGAPTGPVPVI